MLWALVAVLAVTTVALALLQLFRAPVASPSYHRLTFEAGTVYSARFAPDGQSIVYSAAWDNKPMQLFSTVGNSLAFSTAAFTDATLLGCISQ